MKVIKLAKLTFISPDTTKKHRYGADLVFKSGDSFHTRYVKTYRKRKCYVTTKSNMTFVHAAAAWLFTTIAQGMNWLDYQPNVKKSRSPRNAFMANNIQILHHYLPGISPVLDISCPPEYPDLPTCIEAYFDADNNLVVFSWKENYLIEMYIALGVDETTYRYVMPWERYRIRGAEVAVIETASVSGDWFIANSKAHVAIRACNERGEVSPWSDAIEIEVPDKPKTDFSATPRSGVSPLQVQFTNLSTGNIISYLWEFGDGCTSELENPSHDYEGMDVYFSPKLICYGVAGSKNTKRRYDYIKVSSSDVYDEHIFITDGFNRRICKKKVSDFSHILIAGSRGSSDDQYEAITGIAADLQHLYICDPGNSRIVKRQKATLVFDSKYGTPGSGNDQLNWPTGIAVDANNIYIWDSQNNRIMIRSKSDLSFVAKIDSIPSGGARFSEGTGICVDDLYLYISDHTLNRIVVFNKSDWSYSRHLDNDNIEIGSLDMPTGIAVDTLYIWIINTGKSQIIKKYKSNFNHCISIGSAGDGDYQFNVPIGVTLTDRWIYVVDQDNNCVKRYSRYNFVFDGKVGGWGTGTNNLSSPYMAAIQGPFEH